MNHQGRRDYGEATYEYMLTPDKKGIVDAEFFSKSCFMYPETDLEKHIISFISDTYKDRARVSLRKKKRWYIPRHYKHFL